MTPSCQSGAKRHAGAKAHRTRVHLARASARGYGSEAVAATNRAPASASASLNLNAPLKADSPTMADSSNGTFFSAYPGIVSQGGGDDHSDVYAAALIAQGDASTQRNQDSHFVALRSEAIGREVADSKRETAQAKYDLAVQTKDAEVRAAERNADVKAELAALRAEMQANTIAQLRVELSETKADSRQSRTESMLAGILAKLPV